MKKKVLDWFKSTSYWKSIVSIDIRVVYATLFDGIFIGLLYLISLFIGSILGLIDFSAVNSLQTNPENIDAFSGVVSAMTKFMLNMILFFILIVGSLSITRLLIYNTILKKKFSWKKYLWISIAYLGYVILFMLFIGIVSKIVYPEMVGYVSLIFLLILIYVVSIFNIHFVEKGKISAIKSSWNMAFGKIHLILPKMLLAMLTILIVFGIVHNIFLLLNYSLNPTTAYIISIVETGVFLFLLAWMKSYNSIVVVKLLKR